MGKPDGPLQRGPPVTDAAVLKRIGVRAPSLPPGLAGL